MVSNPGGQESHTAATRRRHMASRSAWRTFQTFNPVKLASLRSDRVLPSSFDFFRTARRRLPLVADAVFWPLVSSPDHRVPSTVARQFVLLSSNGSKQHV